MSDAERRLWMRLRAHRFDGLSFRRQTPIGPYIADFVCHEVGLVIELDGGQHGGADHQKRDRVRDDWLASKGYRVLRLWNVDVLKNLDGVLATILLACGEQAPPSQPSPSRGEGSGRAFFPASAETGTQAEDTGPST